jgi:hypothetical protein
MGLPFAPPVGIVVVVNTSPSTDTTYDLDDEIREALITAAFLPLEPEDHTDDELQLTDRDIKILNFYVARGWEAFRLEPAGDPQNWVTLARWSDNGIELLALTSNGVETATARFDLTNAGVTWFAAAINAEAGR